jgi:hypothetical protein
MSEDEGRVPGRSVARVRPCGRRHGFLAGPARLKENEIELQDMTGCGALACDHEKGATTVVLGLKLVGLDGQRV